MALDKFQPYLFVSAGEQSNKYLTPVYSDGIASFQAQRAQSLTGLTVRIDPIQEGTGDPSPTNIRPISGRTGLTVTVQSGETQNEYPITWETEAGTVYGGTLDVVSGVLTVDRIFRECDANSDFGKGGATSFNEYFLRNSAEEQVGASGTLYGADNIICSHAASLSASSTTEVFTRLNGGQARIVLPLTAPQNTLALFKTWLGEQATAGTPLQFCYKLATPQTYQLTGAEVRTIAGFNQIYSDAGPIIDIKF